MLKFDLQPGEETIWEGTPENFKILDSCTSSGLVRDLLMMLLGGILIGAECWLFSGNRPGLTAVLITVMLLCVPVAHLILDAVKLRRTRYIATNRRLLVVNRDARDVEYSRIHSARMVQDRAGHTSLLCGDKAIQSGDATYRERTVFGLDALLGDAGEDTPCDSFAFYAISDPAALKRALAPYLSLT